MSGGNQNGDGGGKGILIALLILLALWAFGSAGGEASKQREIDAFESQLHKEPAAWTQEEKKRYNDFVEWSDKN